MELGEFDEIRGRAIFKICEQKRFLREAKTNLGIKWTEFEDLVVQTGYSSGSLRNWRSETCSMPLNMVRFISSISGLEMPAIEIKGEQWGRAKGGNSFTERFGAEALRELGRKGRANTLRKHGPNAFEELASLGGTKARKLRLGIFAEENKENAKNWRKIPFINKIGIFDRKYDAKRAFWRFKGFVESPKRNVPTMTGANVRSEGEKKILEFLVENGFKAVYEPRQIFAEGKYIVPDFGFEDSPNLFVEYMGRSDDSYWRYKIPRWLFVLKNCDARFILIVHDLVKAKIEFGGIPNVLGILQSGKWDELRSFLQLCLKRNQLGCG